MDDTLKKFFIMLFFLYILGVALISSNGPLGIGSLPIPPSLGSIAKFEFTPPV